LAKDVPVVPIAQTKDYAFAHKGIKGLQIDPILKLPSGMSVNLEMVRNYVSFAFSAILYSSSPAFGSTDAVDDHDSSVLTAARDPGDPVDAVLGGRAPDSVKQEYRQRLGLLDPLWLQYIRYLGSLLSLDLGTSITNQGEAVWDTIQEHFPATVELAVFSMAIALLSESPSVCFRLRVLAPL
jgi:hypothetical protein